MILYTSNGRRALANAAHEFVEARELLETAKDGYESSSRHIMRQFFVEVAGGPDP